MTINTASRVEWTEAKVVSITEESPTVKSYVLKPKVLLPHYAGQHFELRLNGEDGYQAARLYSAAPSSDLENEIRLTIQYVPDGEVTTYVHNTLAVGDSVEIRGPFGRFFVWRPTDPRPILLIGGGSGIVPLAAILDEHTQSSTAVHMLYSARTYEDILYKDTLLNDSNATITLTAPDQQDWNGLTGRINSPMLAEILQDFPSSPICYVCGMSPFVSTVNDALQVLGIPLSDILTERFG